jgi:hypothetical protein
MAGEFSRTRPITPSDPIRRDGEVMLHGNCWMRRARAPGGNQARQLPRPERAGVLPTEAPSKTWGGTGSGKVCDGRGETIEVGKAEGNVQLDGARALRLHPECHRLWDEERGLPRGIAGGSAPSPSTASFDPGR